MLLLSMSSPIENQATAMFSSSIMLLSHGEQLRLLLSRLMLPRVKSLLFPQLLRKLSISENYAMNSASTQTSPSILYEDCEAAVALSKENCFRNRSKHIQLRWSYICERQRPEIGDLQVVSVSRKIMLADVLASPIFVMLFLVLPLRISQTIQLKAIRTLLKKNQLFFV